jgi:hypothetical protein
MLDNLLFNSLFNSPLILTNIKSLTIPLSLVFLAQRSEQYLNPLNVFSLLFSFSSQPLTVDFSTDNQVSFEDLLFYFVLVLLLPLLLSLLFLLSQITLIVITTSQKEFKAFTKLSIHVFSSLSFFYYALRSPNSK